MYLPINCATNLSSVFSKLIQGYRTYCSTRINRYQYREYASNNAIGKGEKQFHLWRGLQLIQKRAKYDRAWPELRTMIVLDRQVSGGLAAFTGEGGWRIDNSTSLPPPRRGQHACAYGGGSRDDSNRSRKSSRHRYVLHRVERVIRLSRANSCGGWSRCQHNLNAISVRDPPIFLTPSSENIARIVSERN